MSESAETEGGLSETTQIEHPRFGNYVLLRHIGSGGMAEVDLARVEGPENIEKIVVVKRIKPELANTVIYRDMFLDEARIASALQHPNIIQIHDVGEIGDQPFIAMEYLRGKNLAELLVAATEANRHLPIDFSVGVICSACRGLHYAHMMTTFDGEPLNIVHRDVSPDNVFLSYEGHVKLVDFGLAKAKGRSTETQVGIVKGTVGYMAPEQFENLEIDRRLDVFALGVLLWEMVAGRRLFESATTREAWDEVRSKPVPSPRVYRPDSPVPLEAIIRRALHKDVEQRYQSAEAMLADLERMAQQQQLWLSPSRRAEVMEALFPGRRRRALRDATLIERAPSPVALPNRTPATGWRAALAELEGLIQSYPRHVLIGLGVLLLSVFVLSLTVRAMSREDPVPIEPASIEEVEPGPKTTPRKVRPRKSRRKRR